MIASTTKTATTTPAPIPAFAPVLSPPEAGAAVGDDVEDVEDDDVDELDVVADDAPLEVSVALLAVVDDENAVEYAGPTLPPMVVIFSKVGRGKTVALYRQAWMPCSSTLFTSAPSKQSINIHTCTQRQWDGTHISRLYRLSRTRSPSLHRLEMPRDGVQQRTSSTLLWTIRGIPGGICTGPSEYERRPVCEVRVTVLVTERVRAAHKTRPAAERYVGVGDAWRIVSDCLPARIVASSGRHARLLVVPEAQES